MLFKRRLRVQLGTTVIDYALGDEGPTGLGVSFDVERSLSRHPNTANIKVYNLGETNRGRVHEQKHYPVQLSVGHGVAGNLTMIFSGDLRKAQTAKEGNDFVTTVEAGDHERAVRRNRVNETFGPRASVRDAAQALVRAAGGQAADVPDTLTTLITGAQQFVGGAVFSGQAATELDRFAQSTGHELSFQDGRPQLVPRGQASSRAAVLLNYDTGLISAPTRDTKGRVLARALIVPDLLPGRAVEFSGVAVSGQFRIESVKYSGATFSNDWYADLVCKEL